MKIAICLSGYVGWIDGPYQPTGKMNDVEGRPEADPQLSFNTAKSKIIDANPKDSIDFFIHSWSTNREEDLKRIFNPVVIVTEPQDPFNKGELTGFGKGFCSGMKYDNSFRCYSKWNAHYRVLSLLREYEEKNEKYDYVMTSRLDMIYYTDLVFEKYNNKTLWISGWGLEGSGRYCDQMFFSSSDIMNGFVAKYKNINKYSQNIKKSGVPTDTHALLKSYAHDITDSVSFFFKEQTDFEPSRLAIKKKRI